MKTGKKMNWTSQFKGFGNAVTRYPLTMLFLLMAATINAVAIQTEKEHSSQLLACIIGAMLAAVLQAAWERFFHTVRQHILLQAVALVGAAGYYCIIYPASELTEEITVRTMAVLLALMFAFIWVPVIQSRYSFNESFMAAWKGFFQAILYAGVLYAGCALILGATDLLIFGIGTKPYLQIANLVFVVFAPIVFFAKIPLYPGKLELEEPKESFQEEEETVKRSVSCPRFLEILISYIVIPLTAVYTIVLLLYIILNIQRQFWTDNLLEPLLVSYAIIVIIVCILASHLTNRFAALFRLIFPKVLVPIVVFQMAASILSISEEGVTYGKYYVILFGLFAAIAGVVMSIFSVRKNGILAATLIVLCIWSIVPPVDAFSISRNSQTALLKSTLEKNDMLKSNSITPKDTISDEDKQKIASSVEYLSRMDYTDDIAWMPENFDIFQDFQDTFGFEEYDALQGKAENIYVSRDTAQPVAIDGYDVMIHTLIGPEKTQDTSVKDITYEGKTYYLDKAESKDGYVLILRDDKKTEILRFDTSEMFEKYTGYVTNNTALTNDQASFVAESENAKMLILVQELNISADQSQTYKYANLDVLLQFK